MTQEEVREAVVAVAGASHGGTVPISSVHGDWSERLDSELELPEGRSSDEPEPEESGGGCN